MKVPYPKDGSYYIQQLYSYGWDIALLDVNYEHSRDKEYMKGHLEDVLAHFPERQYRLVKTTVSISTEVISV